jgi:hypothetical protein
MSDAMVSGLAYMIELDAEAPTPRLAHIKAALLGTAPVPPPPTVRPIAPVLSSSSGTKSSVQRKLVLHKVNLVGV